MGAVELAQAVATEEARYAGYAYAYPHKTAYRHLDPIVSLRSAWSCEDKDSLFLYVHLPFCEMRCGFCNLFTLAHPPGDLIAAYLRTLELEALHVADALGPAKFARMAIGGGTPTFLEPSQLDQLFDAIAKIFSIPLGQIPLSVEASPPTATLEKMQLLKGRGATRASIGVQSFVESEVSACGRAQRNQEVYAALANIRAAGIATLNIDLIYGLPGQSIGSWIKSLEMALSFCPEEIYIYPLYVRPLTGMSRLGMHDEDVRAACYTAGRELLIAAGYQQLSMRMFRLACAPVSEGPAYCCQDDGMVGVGCGARSYTRGLHYSREFAVGRGGIKTILQSYIDRTPEQFDSIDYGCRLDAHEQRRRYMIKSVLRSEGLSLSAYRARFGTEACADIHELLALIDQGFLSMHGDMLRPTQKGIDYSDVIGPRLFSPAMCRAMQGFELQ